MILRELITKFGFQVDDSGVQKIDKAINQAKKGLGEVAERAQNAGKSLTLFVTAPLLGLAAASVKVASDAEETFSKFGVVFRDLSKESENVASNLQKNFGLSSVQAKQLLGDTGDLLTGFGFTQKSALDLSSQVNELAVDLASFTNFSGGAEGASKALTKALLGERESIKSLGISILDEDVKARVLLNTQKGLTFETERQAKAYATLQIAQEQSKNAIGDYARTSGGLANVARRLGARITDLGVSFGKILIPIVTKAALKAEELLLFFTGLSERTKTIILVIGGLVAVVGPLLLALGFVVSLVITLISGFTALAVSIGVTNAQLLLFIAYWALVAVAAVAAVALIILVLEDLYAFFTGEDSLTGIIVAEFGKAFDYIGELFNGLPGIVQAAIALATTPVRAFFSLIRAAGGALGALSEGDFSGALDALTEGVQNVVDPSRVLGNGLGGLLGLGPTQSGTTAAVSGGSTANVEAPITVNVPPNTPPEEVAQASREGVRDGLQDLFQETGRQLQTPISE